MYYLSKMPILGTELLQGSHVTDCKSAPWLVYYLTKIKGYTLKGARERIKGDRKNVERNAAVSATLLRLKHFLVELKDELK